MGITPVTCSDKGQGGPLTGESQQLCYSQRHRGLERATCDFMRGLLALMFKEVIPARVWEICYLERFCQSMGNVLSGEVLLHLFEKEGFVSRWRLVLRLEWSRAQ